MAIEDLKPRQGKVELVAEVVDMGEIRSFEKFGKSGKVCNATIRDATGEVRLTLWNEQIDMLKVGDKIKITNGYVNEWQGEKQLTTGKFGKLEVMSSGEAAEKPAKAKPAAPPSEEEVTQDELQEAEESYDTAEEEPDVDEEKVE